MVSSNSLGVGGVEEIVLPNDPRFKTYVNSPDIVAIILDWSSRVVAVKNDWDNYPAYSMLVWNHNTKANYVGSLVHERVKSLLESFAANVLV